MARRRQGTRWTRAFVGLILLALGSHAQTELNYPPTRRELERREIHGLLVDDPYRWLEATRAAEVREWLRAETELTASFVAGVAELEDALRPLLAAGGGASVPRRGGTRLFFVRTERRALGTLHELCVLADGASAPSVLLGPGATELLGLIDLRPAPDGAHLALAVPGEPQVARAAWRVLDVEARAFLADMPAAGSPAGAGDLAWLPGGEGFLVVLHDEDGTVRVSEHPLDARLSDTELFRETAADASYELDVSPDGRYAVLTATQDAAPRRILVLDRDEPRDGFRQLFEDPGVPTSVVHVSDGLLWLRTELDAPRGRIVELDLTRAERDAWGEFEAQRDERLVAGTPGGARPGFVGGRFVLPYRGEQEGQNAGVLFLRVLGENGELQHELPFPPGLVPSAGVGPGAGTSWLAGTFDRPELFVRFVGPTEPGVVLRFDLESGARQVFHRPQLPFDPEAFVAETVRVPAADGSGGSVITVSLTRRRDRAGAGPLRTWLVVENPLSSDGRDPFEARYLAFLQAGGVLARADVRGATSDLAPSTPAARVQLAVDDVLAVAEWLVASETTTPARLVAGGRGVGGLVAAAALLQRPALFGAGLIDFAPLDVLTSAAGRGPGGDALGPDDLAAVRALSPYHKLLEGSVYPAVLVTTSEGDPWFGQAAKFVAALQYAQSGRSPALLQVAWDAGRAAYGSPQHGAARTWATQLAFLEKVLE